MKWREYIDEAEVRKTISMLKPDGQLFEVRILGGQKKNVISGYFTDVETMLQQFDRIDPRGKNIYITLNKVNQDCYARQQRDCFRQVSQTTQDTEIDGYQWLFIDLDPVRATGISSSEEELNAAKVLAKKVYEYLRGLGFEDPVKALSGNGCHLLYRILIKNDAEGRALVEQSLKVLSALFDTDMVKIDTTNYNPSRICKLHGTLAQKGANTPERPHRMSRIFTNDMQPKVTSKIFLEKLVAELPEEPKPEKPKVYQKQEFDLVDFMRSHGMTYEERQGDRAVIYNLDECPFNHSHTDGDAKIFHYPNGAIAFKCHHNSCRSYKWQDVRRLYEPDAYDRKDDFSKYDEGWKQHNREKENGVVQYQEVNDDEQMFRNASEIIHDSDPEHEFVRTGITIIDQKMQGLEKQCISVISGTRGSGKSTIIAQLINNAVNDGQTVVCYSGELNNKKYLNWLIKQAAGKNHVQVTASGVKVSMDDQQKIIDWYGDKFWLYNNKCGNKFNEIEKRLRVELKKHKADLCIIDNLMALDLASYDKDRYEAQTKFVWSLKNLAELTNTHILFVAHPRKAQGFLRLDDISGSGNIANIVDNAFIIHRWNRDFVSGYENAYKKQPDKDGIPVADNVIEIVKSREDGIIDEFIPLYFEEATKRLRNSKDEYIEYGWLPESEFEPIDDMEIPF